MFCWIWLCCVWYGPNLSLSYRVTSYDCPSDTSEKISKYLCKRFTRTHWEKETLSLQQDPQLNRVCVCMMMSSNGNIFRVTGHLCGEFTGTRWIPHTKASDAELWCFSLICVYITVKQSGGWWFETLSRPLWRHCNVCDILHPVEYVSHWITQGPIWSCNQILPNHQFLKQKEIGALNCPGI